MSPVRLRFTELTDILSVVYIAGSEWLRRTPENREH
jgi:hypothetical protein